jgi:hypothetical protein
MACLRLEYGQCAAGSSGHSFNVHSFNVDGTDEMIDTLQGGNGDAPPGGAPAPGEIAAAPLSGFVRDAIGRSLQAHFDDIVNAPVPDKFLILLAELEAKERSNGG